MHDLRDEHETAPVERVGDDAPDEREDDDRHDLDEADEPERETFLVGRSEERDVPQDRGRLHHRAGERNELADPEEPEVAMLERGERELEADYRSAVASPCDAG